MPKNNLILRMNGYRIHISKSGQNDILVIQRKQFVFYAIKRQSILQMWTFQGLVSHKAKYESHKLEAASLESNS